MTSSDHVKPRPVASTDPRGLFRLLAGLGTVIVFLSMFMPWVVVNLFGGATFSLADLYVASLRAGSGGQLPVLVGSPGRFASETAALTFLSLLYLVSLVLGIVSFVSRKATVMAGTSAILTGVGWVSGMGLLKSLVAGSNSSGGLLDIIALNTSAGYGAYCVMLGGAILILASLSGRMHSRAGLRQAPETPKTSYYSAFAVMNVDVPQT